MKFYLGLGLIALLLLSCATKQIAPDSLAQDRLFPSGVYEHRVSLISNEPGTRSQSFKGVVSLQPDKIEVVALSFFGTTIFRISENLLSGEIKSEIFIEKLKSAELQLRQYYIILRTLLIAPKSGDWNGHLAVVEHDDLKRPKVVRTTESTLSEFTISSYDENGVPEQIHSKTQAVEVKVKVTGYKLSP